MWDHVLVIGGGDVKMVIGGMAVLVSPWIIHKSVGKGGNFIDKVINWWDPKTVLRIGLLPLTSAGWNVAFNVRLIS